MGSETMTSPDTAGNDPRQQLREQEREIDRLRVLLDISKAMTSELELNPLLFKIMDKTKEALEADRHSPAPATHRRRISSPRF